MVIREDKGLVDAASLLLQAPRWSVSIAPKSFMVAAKEWLRQFEIRWEHGEFKAYQNPGREPAYVWEAMQAIVLSTSEGSMVVQRSRMSLLVTFWRNLDPHTGEEWCQTFFSKTGLLRLVGQGAKLRGAPGDLLGENAWVEFPDGVHAVLSRDGRLRLYPDEPASVAFAPCLAAAPDRD